MFVLADPIIDLNAMWKICLVVLVAGTGTVVAFGFLLLGLKLANRLGTADTDGAQARPAGYLLSVACALICVGIVVVGVFAMVNKPS
jgi:hypothetical protein